MIDKVQKIKEFLIGMEGAACCDAKTKKNIETIILPFIDSMQKEHVSEIDFKEEIQQHFGIVRDFTLCVNIAKHFYDKGYFNGHIHDGDRIEHVDGRRVNVSRLQRVAKPTEELASEDLEKAAVEAFKQIVDENRNSFLEIFKAGAKWQAEQFEKERLKHCDELTDEQAQIESDFVTQHLKENSRTPTFIDAIEYGYLKAEKDLELTWEDMECIIKHYQDIMAEKNRVFVRVEDYQEVLKRFKEKRENP